MAIGIAELIVSSNEASQALVNLKQKHEQTKRTMKQVRDEAAAIEQKFADAVSATEALPDGQVKVEAEAKAASLRAERQALQKEIEADLTSLGITF